MNRATRRTFLLKSATVLAGVLPLAAVAAEERAQAPRRKPATGPLRVHPRNRRYFSDGSGRAIRLAGHQIFCDLQDNSFAKELTYDRRRTLDWECYLDFAARRHLNFLRNWVIWSTGRGVRDPYRTATPMMYQRTGPGKANDGLPKFDLRRFDQKFFDRLRARVQEARQRGLYVSIMLFEPYGFGPGEDSLWRGNVFNGDNNVNGVDVNADGNEWGVEFFYTKDPAIRALQYAYVEKVIDTVNDLDNVLYEVANEVHAPEWQHAIIRHVHEYQARKPRQHPVYMSPGGRTARGGWTDHTPQQLLQSPADCVGVKLAPRKTFLDDPPVADPTKPMFWDNDHGFASLNPCPHRIPWMAFMRGYHFVLYDRPFESPEDESGEWDRTRLNIGATVAYGERMDLVAMAPYPEKSSTRYCLADPGREYLVYQPNAGAAFTVELKAGKYQYEWFSPTQVKTADTGSIEPPAAGQRFEPPFEGDAVLYLKALDWSFAIIMLPEASGARAPGFSRLPV